MDAQPPLGLRVDHAVGQAPTAPKSGLSPSEPLLVLRHRPRRGIDFVRTTGVVAIEAAGDEYQDRRPVSLLWLVDCAEEILTPPKAGTMPSTLRCSPVYKDLHRKVTSSDFA